MKTFIAALLLASLLFYTLSAIAESVKISLHLEGTVVGAQRFRQGAGYTTKIILREDVGHVAAESRRFCGDWEKQINRLRGKYVRLDLRYKEYGPSECREINSIKLLNNPAHAN